MKENNISKPNYKKTLRARFVDKIGYRISIVTSEIFSAVGLVALAFLPELLPSAFAGIMISVVLYAIGSGLIEVLCSPIVEACPFENKEKTMSLLHRFSGWLLCLWFVPGQVSFPWRSGLRPL